MRTSLNVIAPIVSLKLSISFADCDDFDAQLPSQTGPRSEDALRDPISVPQLSPLRSADAKTRNGALGGKDQGMSRRKKGNFGGDGVYVTRCCEK